MSDVLQQARHGFRETPRARQPVLEQGNMGSIAGVELEHVPDLALCHPGLLPTEYNVIIAPAVMPEKTKGNIILADETKDRQSGAMQVGRLVAASPLAFRYEPGIEWEYPTPGVIVWFARYAGGEFVGADGRTYRIVKDKDIGAVIPE